MRVAISTDGEMVAAHFGRCEGYTIADIADGTVTSTERIDNPGHEPGFLPSYLADRGVECIVAGGMGPRAHGLFAERRIQTVVGVTGRVADALSALARGDLKGGESTCDH
jgi:predicted Fe-Mo cluster-binding NifX family protein